MFQLPTKIPLKITSSKGHWKPLHSPNNYQLLTEVQQATADDIELILAGLDLAQKEIKRLSPLERSKIILSVASKLDSQLDYLAWVIASEGGKPLKDATVEVERAISTLKLCAEEAVRLHGDIIPMERTPAGKNHLSFTVRDPIGPVLAISAFNHPLNLIAHQVGCAIAAGCSIVLKPSSSTPICAFILEEAFHNSGLPLNVFRMVNCETKYSEILASSPKFGYVSFIGSAKVGWEMRKKIAPGTRISMEHGGQAAAVVRKDADLGHAVRSLTKGAFYHAGQVCISTQRIFVHEEIYMEFLTHFRSLAAELRVGPATEADTDVGPLIKKEEVTRIKSWIEEAVSSGAIVELGNNITGNESQYLYPTILSNVPRTTKLMTEEVFGPVVCVNPYRDEFELLEYLNSNPYIFESALFTQDISKALQIAKDVSAMTFVINDHTAFRVDQMPFGGHGLSGYGMGGVQYMIEEMTRLKQVIIKY